MSVVAAGGSARATSGYHIRKELDGDAKLFPHPDHLQRRRMSADHRHRIPRYLVMPRQKRAQRIIRLALFRRRGYTHFQRSVRHLSRKLRFWTARDHLNPERHFVQFAR